MPDLEPQNIPWNNIETDYYSLLDKMESPDAYRALSNKYGIPKSDIMNHIQGEEERDTNFLKNLGTATRVFGYKDPAQAEYTKNQGEYWKLVRMSKDMTRGEIVSNPEFPLKDDQLTFFEGGITSLTDLPENFLPKYAEILNAGAAYDLFMDVYPELEFLPRLDLHESDEEFERYAPDLSSMIKQMLYLPNVSEETTNYQNEIGQYWQIIRETKDKSLKDISINMEISMGQLFRFENGLISLDDLPDGFLEKLVKELDADEEFQEFNRRFNSE